MDYKTKKISRNKIRFIAKIYRKVFHDCISKDGVYVDVIKLFELTPHRFNNITTEIVDDNVLDNIPGRCNPDFNGNYHIQIKESVYNGAVEGIGGYRTHIIHELSHAFLCMFGYTPVCDRSFKNKELIPCESMEWQAKALAGEILMEYNITKGMSIEELIEKCGVSIDGAYNRMTRDKKGGGKNQQ